MTLIDFGTRDEWAGMLGFSAEDRIEAWAMAISQAQTLFDCTRLDFDCIHATEIAVKRGRPRSRAIPQAQAMLAQRRAQIIATMAHAAAPSVPGGFPASTDAIGHTAPAKQEQHQW